MSSQQNGKLELVNEGFAQLIAFGRRSPILRRPSDYGLEYEDIWFPSLDGVILEGWFIPKPNSDKLVIANHPLPCNRSGYPGHLEGYNSFGGFEVNFVKDYKALHDAGYNVICYDMRNHGRSGQGSGGYCGIGQLEYRDVVGSIKYVQSRKELASKQLVLLSRCLGANSTMVAMSKHPEYFKDVKAMVALQPVSIHALIITAAKAQGQDVEEAQKQFSERSHQLTGFYLSELTPLPYTKYVTVPTLVAQTHRDSMTTPSDVQEIYDTLGSKQKELFWIEGTDRRFDGYNYFGEHPERLVAWFDKYTK